jgi:putative ABC transport system permease protein
MAEEPRWRRYLRLWGTDTRTDVEEELSFHLEERASLNESLGLPPARARAEAEWQFGDVERIRSECLVESERESHRMEIGERLGDIARDIRIACRSLARAPVYTATAGAALALGIGASAAVFTVVSAVLLRPLPYADPDRVVAVHNRWEGSPEMGLSPAEYLDHAERTRAFSAFGVYATTYVNLEEGDGADRVSAAAVTPSTFDALGVNAVHGRLFDAAEGVPGAAEVVVLSHDFWQARFNGSANAIGRDILVNGTIMTIVGVLPSGVRLPDTYADADPDPPALFVPYAVDRAAVTARGSHFLAGVARLAPGWTVATANGEVSRVAREMVATYPDDYPADMRFDAFLRTVHMEVVADARGLLLLLSGAVALVLLIACANVSSLVLTRTEDRRRELAVRSALGGGRWRIARQLLIEHLVLALLAAAAGLFIAHSAVTAIVLLQPEIPRLAEARLDLGAVAFTGLLTLVVTLLVTLAPLRLGVVSHGALRESGARTTATRASHRVRRILIGAEVALSLVLLTGAGLLLRSFTNLLAVDPGYRTEQVLAVPVSLPATSYPDDESRRRFFAQLVDDAARLPGVLGAGAVSNLPLAAGVGDLNIQIEGRETAAGDVSARLDWQIVTPGWLEAMGVELVRGRTILPSDDARAIGAVVLSETAARKYWPDADAIGKRFRLGGGAGPGTVTVVGIVRDVRHGTLSDQPAELMYLPHAQFTFWNGGRAASSLTVVLHTAAEPLSLLTPLREQVRRLDPHVPLGAATTMAQVRGTAVAAPRFALSVIGSFALLALALAMIGIYGLVSYTVARRTREIAVRMALGADAGGVVRQIVAQAMRPVMAGVLIGGAAALALSRTVQQLLFDVTPHDPVTIAAALVLLPATALAACVLPARRATRIAPLSALRED